MDKTDLIFSPNSKSYKSVREKKSAKPRKTMRRSMSFSEGQLPQMTMHKSGYNEEASSKYNVVTTCVATEEDKMSNSEKIKVLLLFLTFLMHNENSINNCVACSNFRPFLLIREIPLGKITSRTCKPNDQSD